MSKGNGEGWSLHLSHLPQEMDFEFILGRVWINCNLQQVNSLSRCHQVLQLTDLSNCSRKAWITGYSEIHTGTKTVGPNSQLPILQSSLKTGSSTKVTFIPAPKVDEKGAFSSPGRTIGLKNTCSHKHVGSNKWHIFHLVR